MTPVTAASRHGGQAAEAPPPGPASSEADPVAASRLLGELLVREGLITDAQLAAALAACEARPGAVSLEEVLLEDGAVSRADLERVRSRYRRRDRLGDLLVAAGAVSDAQLQLAVDHHLRTGLRLGDALLQLGFLTEDALRQTLSRQLGIGFVDLDRLVLDRRLAPAIPKEYAERHRVLPVAEGDGLLTIAVADPTDAGLAEDLAAVTGARVRLVTSTPAAFQRAFARIYGEDPAVGLARQQHRLEQAYAAVSAELDAARRALAALQEAQDDVLREQGEALRAAAAQSAEQVAAQAAREAELAALRAAHAALRAEHDARGAAHAELLAAHEDTLARLGALRGDHARLEAEHGLAMQALAEARQGRAELERTVAALEAAHAAACQELDERRRAVAALEATLADLRAAHAALEGAHEALQAEHRHTLAEVGELRQRADTVEARQAAAIAHLESVLTRLRDG